MFKESYMREETQHNMLASVWWAYAATTLIEPALKFTYALVCMHTLPACKHANTHTHNKYLRLASTRGIKRTRPHDADAYKNYESQTSY